MMAERVGHSGGLTLSMGGGSAALIAQGGKRVGDLGCRQPLRLAVELLVAACVREVVPGGKTPQGLRHAALGNELCDCATESAEQAVLLQRRQHGGVAHG